MIIYVADSDQLVFSMKSQWRLSRSYTVSIQRSSTYYELSVNFDVGPLNLEIAVQGHTLIFVVKGIHWVTEKNDKYCVKTYVFVFHNGLCMYMSHT